jgi:hypothetical protein
MAHPGKLVSAPKATPQVNDRKSFSMKKLVWRKRSLEIRRDLLSKSVVYDGWEADVAQNNLELRDVQELLRQAA